MAVRQSLTDFIYEQITNRILSGNYVAGSKLPTEEAVAQEFDVSRAVVRNAFARMKREKILQSRRGSGTTVVGMSGARRHSFGPVDSVEDIWKCFEFRLVFEPGTAAIAALQRLDDDITAIETALQKLRIFRSSDMLETVELDMEFHRAVVASSHNRYVEGTYAAWEPQIRFTSSMSANLSQAASLQRQRRIVQDHEAVLQAITSGDPQASAEAMRRHIEAARDTIFRSRFGGGPAPAFQAISMPPSATTPVPTK